ncbi:MAG: hypothetical protein R3C59_15650 [Planctomycetaceae bacterium]
MSAGRRSWRPEKTRKRQDDRRLKIVLLSCVLAALAAFLLLPWIVGGEQPVRFVSIGAGTQKPALQPSSLMTAGDSLSHVSRRHLESVFRRLNALKPGLVEEPVTVNTLDELRNAVQPGEKLVLYCGVPARVQTDSEPGNDSVEVTVFLIPGTVGSEIRFSKLLDALKLTGASQIVLLMDLVNREAGLANGVLSDDVVGLINAAVQDADVAGLSLICSSETGQRSWEFLTPEATESTSASTAGEGSVTGTTHANFGLFSGTVFAHFIAEAFVQTETQTAKSLGDYLRQNVADWVKDHYGETQTVTMSGRNVNADLSELLRQGSWSAEDVADTRDPNAPPPPETDTVADASGETDAAAPPAKESQPIDPETPDAKLARLLEAKQALDVNSRAIAPGQWMELNAQILSTQDALLNGDADTYAVMHDGARRTLDDIRLTLKTAAASDTENTFAAWLNTPDTLLTPAAEEEKIVQDLQTEIDDFTADAATANSVPSVPRSWKGKPFTDALVRSLENLADAVSGLPGDQSARIEPHVRLIRQLGQSRPGSWSKKDWPQQLFTMDEVLAGANAAPDRHVLQQLMQLIDLRQKTLTIVSGRSSDGGRLRRQVWESESTHLAHLLTRLTAAESWLVMGPGGRSMAEQSLYEAQSQFSRLSDLLKEQQQRAAIRDAQHTDLAFIIQYLAQQHEQVPLTSRELDAALLLAETDSGRMHFPDGLLRQLDMDASHIDAMFALTRPLGTDLSESDLRFYELLDHYIRQRMTSSVCVEERHRLLNIPGFESESTELIASLQGSGPEAATGDNRTGIWLGFWSLRLLDAVSGQPHTKLWADWKQIVQLVRDKDANIAVWRTRLAEQLQKQWQDYRTKQNDSPASTVFVTQSDAAELLSQDLAQRRLASARNSELYGRIHQDLFGKSLPTRSVEFSVGKSELMVDSENRAQIDVKSGGGSAIYVSHSDFVLEQLQADLKQDWLRLNNNSPQRSLVFRTNNGLTQTVPLTLAMVNTVNDIDIVVATQQVTVHPGDDTQWKIEFLRDGTALTLYDGKELRLPPTTLDEAGKDASIPLTLRLSQHDSQRPASVKQVTVQAYTFPDGRERKVWDQPQVLDVVNYAVLIPLIPASKAETAAAAGAVASAPAIDLLNGMTFEVTPVGFETKSRRIVIQPVLLGPSHYVVTTPDYNAATRTLSLSVQPRTDRDDPFWPTKIPVEVDFSPALNRLRQGEAAMKAPALPGDGKTFEFVFREDIEQAFRRDSDLVDDENNLEFGLSVAGIPHAWRWQLKDDGVRALLSDEPIVRAELTLSADNKVPPVPTDRPSFLFAKDPQNEPTFDVRMHIFRSGRFNAQNPDWELNLRVQNAATEIATPVLDIPIRLRSPHAQTITASGADGAVWKLSTHTQSYQRTGLKIDEQLGLGPGRYRLIADLSRTDRTRTQPVEHQIPFVIDGTPPEVTVNVPTAGEHFVTRILSGRVTAEDRESDVSAYQVTLEGGEPVNVRPNGEFQIPIEQFPEIQVGEGETKTKSRVLTVIATNGAGLASNPVKQPVVFVKRGPPKKKMAPKPAPPGIVLFESESKEEFEITLWKSGNLEKKGKGVGMIELKDVKPGTYKLNWTGPSVGQTAVTVKSGETTKVKP